VTLRNIAVVIVVTAGLSASAQTPSWAPTEAKVQESYSCPDPAERSTKPECCRVTVEIDKTGKALSAKAICTHPSYVDAEIQCELQRSHEPRLRTGGVREGYSKTFTRTHLPRMPKSREDFMGMMAEANKRCDLLGAGA